MNPGETELLTAVAKVVAVFDELGVEYLVGGSIASSVFGEPRQTIDADLVARFLGRHAEPLVHRLGQEYYAEVSSIRAAVQTQGSFNLIHIETATKVDVFVRWRDSFGQSQLARRQSKLVGESSPIRLFFASPEDTVLSKLEWYSKGGCVSDRQWRDLIGVIKVQAGVLDKAYMREWANTLGVAELLRRALAEAGLSA